MRIKNQIRELMGDYHFDYLNVAFSDGYRQRECLRLLAKCNDSEAVEFIEVHKSFAEEFLSEFLLGRRPDACCEEVEGAYRLRDRRIKRELGAN